MTDDFERNLRETLRSEAQEVRNVPGTVTAGIQSRIGGRSLMAVRLAAVAVPLALVAILGYNAYQLGPGKAKGPVSPASTASATAEPASPEPTSPEPSAAATPQPPFACSTATTGGNSGVVGQLVAVRAAHQTGFDRVTFEFSSASMPQYDLTLQPNTNFTTDASGMPVTLAGTTGMRIHFPMSTGQGSYAGSTDLKANLDALKEVYQLGDFERVLTWGLGIQGPACYRVSELTGPTRLVIDLAVAG